MSFSKAAFSYKLLSWLCVHTPDKLLKIILPPIASVYKKFDLTHSKFVRNNLKVISEHTGRDCLYLEKEVYLNFAMFMVEFFRVGSQSSVIPSKETKDKIVKELGQPGEKANLILVGHYGNWEVALQHLLGVGYSVTTVVMNHSDKKVDEFFLKMRYQKNIRVSYLDQGLRSCIKAIKKKEVIALACERDYTGNGVPVNIAGREVFFPVGPAWLISKYSPDTYLGIYKRLALGEFDKSLQKLEFDEKESDLNRISQTISDNLFEHIYKNPAQWITFDDFFKTTKNEEQ